MMTTVSITGRGVPRLARAARIARGAVAALVLVVGATAAADRADAQGGATAADDSTTAQAGGERRDRGQLERAARTRVAALIRQQVDLTDAQMAKLQPVNDRFEQRRLALVRRERQTRVELRNALAEGEGSAVDARIAGLLQQSIDVQRDRLNLLDAEQKELAAFMSARQRARYLDLQLRMRARLEEVQRRRGAAAQGRRPGRAMRPPQ